MVRVSSVFDGSVTSSPRLSRGKCEKVPTVVTKQIVKKAACENSRSAGRGVMPLGTGDASSEVWAV